jgi:predicted dinucleotide-binding enzyme
VAIADEDAGRAAEAAKETGARAAEANRDAIADAQVVILAVPFEAVEAILRELGTGLNDTIVVDVSNRFAADELSAPSNAEKIQKMTEAPVIKAFNTIFAAKQSDPEVDGMTLDGFVAGDDARAKETVLSLVESLGFRPIDTGPLAMARALEGMGALNISLNMNNGWAWQTGWKLLGPTE